MIPFAASSLNLRNFSLFDIAHSGFAVAIVTFIFPVYFSNIVVGDAERGAALWGVYIGASGFLAAVLAPILGIFIDRRGHAIGWIRALTALLIFATAALWFIKPGLDTAELALVAALIVLANTTYELAISTSNALLPAVAGPARMGRASNIAWGAGYMGGVVALGMCLIFFTGIGFWRGLFDLTNFEATNIRACFPFIALWIGLFALPLLLTKSAPVDRAHTQSWPMLKETLTTAWRNKNMRLFLIGSAIYRDGLATLFAMGAVYAHGVYGLDAAQVMVFGIWLNVMAGWGGLLLARYDDKIGSRKLVLFCLAALVVVGTGLLFIEHPKHFMYAALALGIFLGPAQAAGRTWLARLVPEQEMGRMFGVYALTGRSVSFLGPLVFSAVVVATGHLQAGMASILLFWVVGAVILYFVTDRMSGSNSHAEHPLPKL